MDERTIRPYALQAGVVGDHIAELGTDFVVTVGEQGQGRRLAVLELATRRVPVEAADEAALARTPSCGAGPSGRMPS